MVTSGQILTLYYQRPKSMVALRLGQWFMNAHKIEGHSEIYNWEMHRPILSEMERLGWLTFDTAPLMQYNQTGQ